MNKFGMYRRRPDSALTKRKLRRMPGVVIFVRKTQSFLYPYFKHLMSMSRRDPDYALSGRRIRRMPIRVGVVGPIFRYPYHRNLRILLAR